MAAKQKQASPRREDAAQVFRQFAWHLAGTLAAGKATGAPRPPKKASR